MSYMLKVAIIDIYNDNAEINDYKWHKNNVKNTKNTHFNTLVNTVISLYITTTHN